ncbi:hypothetical protein T439DRAFT_110895 [Meredithblackwellia eburnea MCA 4105]
MPSLGPYVSQPSLKARVLHFLPPWTVLAATAFSFLLLLVASPSLPSQLSRTPSSKANPSLHWHDFSRIRAATRSSSSANVVAPVYLRHLEQYRAPPPFRTIYIVSSWLDTRPILADRPPVLTLVAAMQGAPFINVQNGSRFSSNPMECFVSMRSASGQERFGRSKSTVNGIPDIHEWDKELVTVMYNCPLQFGDDEAPVDWEGAEIFVTLSLPTLNPPSDVFTEVHHLPKLDSAQHRTGHGPTGVCLPPLTGDLYAPFLRDFVAYYRALGFTHFFPYLFNPGPETLRVLRDIARDENIRLVRFGMPAGWTWSGVHQQKPNRNFHVDPTLWSIPGVGSLPPDVELGLGGTVNGEYDVQIWYFGQGVAQQDCNYRAMQAGMRWVAHVDWDEYLFLRPAHGKSWPPPATAMGGSHFTEWARTVERLWTWPETLNFASSQHLGVNVEKVTEGMLPASFTFLSGFGCIKCQPSGNPPESISGRKVQEGWPGFSWERPGFAVPMVFTSPVRQEHWFGAEQRTKYVLDPWAWWSIGIHLPGLGYAEHATSRGFCSSSYGSSPRSESDSDCASNLLRTLGRNTVIVRTSPPVLTTTTPESNYGQGSLFHFRVDSKLSKDMVEFYEAADKFSMDVLEGTEGKKILAKHRVEKGHWKSQYGEGDSVALVQDWSIAEVMGEAMLEIMERKQEYGATKWLNLRVSRGSNRFKNFLEGRAKLSDLAWWGVLGSGLAAWARVRRR